MNFKALQSPILAVGVTRIFASWLAVAHPTKTHINLGNVDLVVKDGEAAKIKARLSGVVPDRAALELVAGEGRPRKPSGTSEEPDYSRWFTSSLSRNWTNPQDVSQLVSLFTGEFLVIDVGGAHDPTLPPELKAIQGSGLARTASSVPEAIFSLVIGTAVS